MPDLFGFAGEVLSTGVISGILLTVAAYLGRVQITNLLNRDIERVKIDLLHQLEAAKAKHQRELELYKVALIADVERTKARQDLKKSAGMRIIDLEMSAIIETYHALKGVSVEMLITLKQKNYEKMFSANEVAANLFKEEFLKSRAAANEHVFKLRSAFNLIEIFLTTEQKKIFVAYIDSLNVIQAILGLPDRYLTDDEIDAFSEDVFSKERDLVNMIKVAMNSAREM
ncbi:hypothetical protein [Delftia sp. HK171]|uniref:hypothetical protein n=1 Tax=Delftia sp. HK171 TaxID=1920191 RepID=UPI0011510F8B|nr:hypothetical protein [Delftia sp. HK171]TQL83094.1 hypothetical protein FB549_0581 [Delftia sp. HK171]